MIDFFEKFSNSTLTWFGIMLSIYFVYYGYRFQASKKPLEKQLYNAYLPLFRLLEPYLNKSIYSFTLSEIKNINDEVYKIIDKHYELVNPDIIYWNKLLREKILSSDCIDTIISLYFSKMCNHIESSFELTRKRMYLPHKSFIFRWRERQNNKSVKQLLLELFYYAFHLIIILLFTLLLTARLFNGE